MRIQHPKTREPEFLPARFGHTRDEPVRGEFPESQARNLEAANKRAAAAAHFATIDHPRGAGIARKLRETHVIFLRLQLSTQGRVFFHGRAFAVVAIDPGRFRHKGTRKVAKNAHDATSFLGVATGLAPVWLTRAKTLTARRAVATPRAGRPTACPP